MLFYTEPDLIRIHSVIPAWNRAAIRLAERLGGTIEGTLAGMFLRHGKPADGVLVGMTKEEFYGARV